MTSPNLAGFREAQERLRQEMGVDVDFYIPNAATYPAGTQLDPETGRPHDPTIQPETGGDRETVTRHVALVSRPLPRNVEDPVETGWAGFRRGESAALSFSTAIYADIQAATACEVKGIEYKITEMIRDPGLDDRYIAYLEAK